MSEKRSSVSSTSSTKGTNGDGGAMVVLNVYDMCTVNSYLPSWMGVGIYHSGIQIYSNEYGYGGHPYAFSGIFAHEPRDVEALGAENFKFKDAVQLGYTYYTPNEVSDLIMELGQTYLGHKYHLLKRNCNHFTDELAKYLTGRGIPPWVNRMASIANCVPFFERCLPKELLCPPALQETVRDRLDSSDDMIEEAEEETSTTMATNSSSADLYNGTCEHLNNDVNHSNQLNKAVRCGSASNGCSKHTAPNIQDQNSHGLRYRKDSLTETTSISGASLSGLSNCTKRPSEHSIPGSSSDRNSHSPFGRYRAQKLQLQQEHVSNGHKSHSHRHSQPAVASEACRSSNGHYNSEQHLNGVDSSKKSSSATPPSSQRQLSALSHGNLKTVSDDNSLPPTRPDRPHRSSQRNRHTSNPSTYHDANPTNVVMGGHIDRDEAERILKQTIEACTKPVSASQFQQPQMTQPLEPNQIKNYKTKFGS